MAPKKRTADTASATVTKEQSVYVLSLTSVNHGYRQPQTRIVGVYSSKEAAAEAGTNVDTIYGKFDEAITDMFEDDHVDNRDDPPENGCLIQIGSRDTGEGDYEKLTIAKFPVTSMSSKEISKSKKKRKAEAKKRSESSEYSGYTYGYGISY